MSVDGNSPRRRESGNFEPVFTKHQDKPLVLQRAKAIHGKKASDFKGRRGNLNDPGKKLSIVKEDVICVFDDSSIASLNLARAQSLGFVSESDSNDSLDKISYHSKSISKSDASGGTTKRRVVFDAKTLALDYAKTGDYIELKRTLENEKFREALLCDGEKSVFDIATRHLRLSLLHLASSYNHLSICKYLVEKGAFVNPKDREGWTPIHCAAAEGHEAVVRLLASVPNIVIHTVNVDDESPCDVAANEYIRTMLKGMSCHATHAHTVSSREAPKEDKPRFQVRLGKEPGRILLRAAEGDQSHGRKGGRLWAAPAQPQPQLPPTNRPLQALLSAA